MDFIGFGAIVPLDYGYEHASEHSLLLVSDNWPSLVNLLSRPFEFLRDARGLFRFDDKTHPLTWEVFGPLTVVLEPLTNPCAQSANSLQALATCLATQVDGISSANMECAGALRGLATQWSSLSQVDWRRKVYSALGLLKRKNVGFYIVEYALMTRIMVIRYVPPKPGRIFFDGKVTAVTFSDFTKKFSMGSPTRAAFMHFDIVPIGGRRHDTVAEAKAQFVVDYITDPIATLSRLTIPGSTLDQGRSTNAFNYCDPIYGHTYLQEAANLIPMSQTSDATQSVDFKQCFKSEKQPSFGRIGKRVDHEPTVVLESVDPWADGKIWDYVPIADREGMKLRKKKMRLGLDDPTAPYPCVLIQVTIGGQTQWVIDPASTIVKNYVAPTLGG